MGILDRLRNDLVGHGPLRVGFNPHHVTQSVAVALGAAVSADETHATLDALANPIRRKILQRLAEATASFGTTMQSVGLSDSSKMSFHVRRLVETGLTLPRRRTVPSDRAGGRERSLARRRDLPSARGYFGQSRISETGGGPDQEGNRSGEGSDAILSPVPVLPGV